MIVVFYLLLNSLIVLRLVTYDSDGATYKWHMSAAAYLLTISSGAQIVDVSLGGATVSIWDVITAAILCILLIRARGNVSRIIGIAN